MDVLDRFIGVAQGALCSTSESIFQYLAPVLSELSTLIGLYHNYQDVVELILELYVESARRILNVLNPEESRKMYNACLQTIQTYAQWNTNLLSLEKASEDEEAFRGIILILDVLRKFLAKSYFDLSTSAPTDQHEAADVVIYGLNIFLPLMTADLLKYPSLCSEYYKTITYIVDMIPEKVCALPSDMLKRLLASVEVGLVAFGSEIMETCLRFLYSFGLHVLNNVPKESEVCTAFQPFLNILLNLTLSGQMPQNLHHVMSEPFLFLICTFPEDYKLAVQTILNNQPDPIVAEKLADEFTKLTDSLEVDSFKHRTAFRDKFLKFCWNVHCFLNVK